MDGVIENEQEYLKQKGDVNYRLKMGHAQTKPKNEVDPKKQKEFEETPEFQTKLQKWHSDRDRYKNQGLPMTYILKMHNEYQEEVRADRALFDVGKLPSHAGKKREEPLTELEKADDYLKKAQAKISELETEIAKLKTDA